MLTHPKKKTKIIATIGPATDTQQGIQKLRTAGVDIIRLNMSHGDHKYAKSIIKNTRKVSNRMGILLDTKGPEIRTKTVKEPFMLKKGSEIILRYGSKLCTPEVIYITYKNLINEIKKGTQILIDDGAIELTVTSIKGSLINCQVVQGGKLSSKKSVNVPNVNIKLPAVSKQDKDDIAFAIEQKVDFIAASFIRNAKDVNEIRKILVKAKSNIQIISKIESREGVENINEILEASDGIMVARGDLGVELPAEEVPIVQKRIIESCNLAAKPVIVATQMLESMIDAPRPTRAETSDVANAILDGTHAIMLSAETAVGQYPVKAVETMVETAKWIEKNQGQFRHRLFHEATDNLTDTLCKSSVFIARDINADFIICPTMSGYTARNVAKFIPTSTIIATTPSAAVARQLSLLYGVTPFVSTHKGDRRSFIHKSVKELVKAGCVKKKHTVVITAGTHIGKSGQTNLIEVHKVSELLK